MCWQLNKVQYVLLQEGGLTFLSNSSTETKTGGFFHINNEAFRNFHDIIMYIRRHDVKGNFPITNSYWLIYKGRESVSIRDLEERKHSFTFETETWQTYINSVHDEIHHFLL